MDINEVWTTVVANLIVLVPGIALGILGYLHFAKRFEKSENVYQRTLKYLVIVLVVVISAITIWFRWDMKRRGFTTHSNGENAIFVLKNN